VTWNVCKEVYMTLDVCEAMHVTWVAGLVEIDDVDTTAEVEEEAEVKPSEEEQCDNR
jgi:hypothetical protein